jgi:hypothetical protein
MSTLKTNTLSNVAGTASTAIENAINGSAKAWVNFNGTGTVAIRASYNVSSITDNGTSDYTANFTNAMIDENYSACISGASVVGSNGQWAGSVEILSITSSQLRVAQTSPSADALFVCIAIFR